MSMIPPELKYTKSHEWVRDDGDGTVTLDEVKERRGDLFASFDENEDGKLTPEEFAVHDQMRDAIRLRQDNGLQAFLYFQSFELWNPSAEKYFSGDIARGRGGGALAACLGNRCGDGRFAARTLPRRLRRLAALGRAVGMGHLGDADLR